MKQCRGRSQIQARLVDVSAFWFLGRLSRGLAPHMVISPLFWFGLPLSVIYESPKMTALSHSCSRSLLLFLVDHFSVSTAMTPPNSKWHARMSRPSSCFEPLTWRIDTLSHDYSKPLAHYIHIRNQNGFRFGIYFEVYRCFQQLNRDSGYGERIEFVPSHGWHCRRRKAVYKVCILRSTVLDIAQWKPFSLATVFDPNESHHDWSWHCFSDRLPWN